MGLITLQGHLLALAGAHKIIKSCGMIMIVTRRRRKYAEHHLYNKLAGISAIAAKLLCGFNIISLGYIRSITGHWQHQVGKYISGKNIYRFICSSAGCNDSLH